MKHKLVRIALVALEALVALGAIYGGVALAAGVNWYPVEWLHGTPFSDYTIPGLVLAMVVGGSSLFATATILTKREVGVLASALAGLILAGYEVVEVALVDHLAWRGLRSLCRGLSSSAWQPDRQACELLPGMALSVALFCDFLGMFPPCFVMGS